MTKTQRAPQNNHSAITEALVSLRRSYCCFQELHQGKLCWRCNFSCSMPWTVNLNKIKPPTHSVTNTSIISTKAELGKVNEFGPTVNIYLLKIKSVILALICIGNIIGLIFICKHLPTCIKGQSRWKQNRRISFLFLSRSLQRRKALHNTSSLNLWGIGIYFVTYRTSLETWSNLYTFFKKGGWKAGCY